MRLLCRTARERKSDTSVVYAGVELDDDGAAPDGLEEVGRRLHRAPGAAAAAARLVRAAGAHLLVLVVGASESARVPFGGLGCWAWVPAYYYKLGPACRLNEKFGPI